MKSVLLACACALVSPSLVSAAALSGSIVESNAAVNLSSVGTLDWARWPYYQHKAGLISNFATDDPVKNYWNDSRIIGDASGVKTGGLGSHFEFTVPAATTNRTLTVYLGGWNSTGNVTVTLPNAKTYYAQWGSRGTYNNTVTITYRGDKAGDVLKFVYRMSSDGGSGSIKLQAAALQGAAASTTGSALLTWNAPTRNTDGTTLTDLAGYNLYYGPSPGTYPHSLWINNGGIQSWRVNGLTAGRWYFVLTAVAADGVESPQSNVVTKVVQ